jgi:hypothetical protein
VIECVLRKIEMLMGWDMFEEGAWNGVVYVLLLGRRCVRSGVQREKVRR